MDPAALGTTIIGLDAIRTEDARQAAAIARPRTERRRSLALRRALAALLHRAAERIAPAPAAAGCPAARSEPAGAVAARGGRRGSPIGGPAAFLTRSADVG